jgi:hypothetical protein
MKPSKGTLLIYFGEGSLLGTAASPSLETLVFILRQSEQENSND